METIIEGNEKYIVHNLLGENKQFRYYRASSDKHIGQELMLKIGITPEQNGILDYEAYILKVLLEKASELEESYAKLEKEGQLNYQIGFPTLVETFISKEQDGRRILILKFAAADTLTELLPISMIRSRHKVRVDPKTSAWILGKLLKIIAFAHNEEITVGNLTSDNILVVREHHLVTILDWSSADFGEEVSRTEVNQEISDATKAVIKLLDGKSKPVLLLQDEQLTNDSYVDFLASLMRGDFNDTHQAHSAFYKTVEALWKREFHPYTTFPLTKEN